MTARSYPLISCLMVTGNRVPLACRAIACYLAQTYIDKELVIVDDGDVTLSTIIARLNRPDIVHIRLPRDASRTLGDLRNLTISAAKGQYLMQWDDDDWYSPLRIEAQFAAISESGDACFLHRWTLAWPSRQIFGISHKRIWEGSMLVRKSVAIRYPALSRGEDTVLVETLLASKAKIALLDSPQLYVYVIHGHNTFPEEHFIRFFQHPAFSLLPPQSCCVIEERLSEGLPSL